MPPESDHEYGAVRNFVGGEWRRPSSDGQDVVRFYTDETVYIER